MRRSPRGSFFPNLLFNIILNADGLIPAAVLTALHFIFDISLKWALAAVLVWLFIIILNVAVLATVSRTASSPERPKKNRNPYSAKNEDVFKN